MGITKNISLAKQGFESSFLDLDFYNKQTADDVHMDLLINMVSPKDNDVVLDLGTGNGYLAFPLAERYGAAKVIGLDIVDDTLKRNRKKVYDIGLDNLEFAAYDGTVFPFENNSVDLIITRYALHHFPDLMHSFREMYRILKLGGKIIISDPTPNKDDSCRFVDKFMQMKPDGHIRFYYLHEYKEMMMQAGFHYVSNTMTEIKFPRKEADKYSDILEATDNAILSGYDIQIIDTEIWITEKVLNMIFVKT
ncbi:class I SAM-dependent methyltransferase [Lacrimispora brassicae]